MTSAQVSFSLPGGAGDEDKAGTPRRMRLGSPGLRRLPRSPYSRSVPTTWVRFGTCLRTESFRLQANMSKALCCACLAFAHLPALLFDWQNCLKLHRKGVGRYHQGYAPCWNLPSCSPQQFPTISCPLQAPSAQWLWPLL